MHHAPQNTDHTRPMHHRLAWVVPCSRAVTPTERMCKSREVILMPYISKNRQVEAAGCHERERKRVPILWMAPLPILLCPPFKVKGEAGLSHVRMALSPPCPS